MDRKNESTSPIEKLQEAQMQLAMESYEEEEEDRLMAAAPDIVPSSSSDRERARLTAEQLYRRHIKNSQTTGRLKTAKRVAIIFLCLFCAFTLLTVTVEAVRVPVVNFIMRVFPDFFSIGNGGTAYHSVNEILIPGYLPAGYSKSKTVDNQDMYITIFTNGSGDTLLLQQFVGEANSLQDFSGADQMEETKVKGQPGAFTINEGSLNLIWGNNPRFMLSSGVLGQEELQKIAESIR